MSFLQPEDTAFDYGWCRHGRSRVAFRGPPVTTGHGAVAVIGGNAAFGKGVAAPYPSALGDLLGLPAINLGIANAGPDVFLGDAGLGELVADADLCVVEVLGAVNLSNRYYTVHPRRNDRFLAASPLLHALFPRVDFTEFNFTRHMLSTLADRDPAAFAEVADHLRTTWETRMVDLLGRCGGRRVLLHLRAPSDAGATTCRLGIEPLLVDAAMVARIARHADRLVTAEAPGTCQNCSAPGPDCTCGEGHSRLAGVLAEVASSLLSPAKAKGPRRGAGP